VLASKIMSSSQKGQLNLSRRRILISSLQNGHKPTTVAKLSSGLSRINQSTAKRNKMEKPMFFSPNRRNSPATRQTITRNQRQTCRNRRLEIRKTCSSLAFNFFSNLPLVPLTHYSITPSLHHSITPSLHHSSLSETISCNYGAPGIE